MVTISDLLENLKGLLDKFYLRKQSSDYTASGVVVTDANKNITTQQSISANSTLISGLSTVAKDGNYSSLNGKPTKLSDFNDDLGSTYLKLTGGTLTGAVSSNSNFTTTGTISGGSVKITNGTASQFLKANGTVDSSTYVKTSSSSGLLKNDGTVMTGGTGANNYAIGNHNHTGTYVDTVTDTITTTSNQGTKLATIKANNTTKGTLYHPKPLGSNVSSGLYRIAVNTDGHITSTSSVSIDSTSGGVNGSTNLITSGAVYDGLQSMSNVTYTDNTHQSSYPKFAGQVEGSGVQGEIELFKITNLKLVLANVHITCNDTVTTSYINLFDENALIPSAYRPSPNYNTPIITVPAKFNSNNSINITVKIKNDGTGQGQMRASASITGVNAYFNMFWFTN